MNGLVSSKGGQPGTSPKMSQSALPGAKLSPVCPPGRATWDIFGSMGPYRPPGG